MWALPPRLGWPLRNRSGNGLRATNDPRIIRPRLLDGRKMAKQQLRLEELSEEGRQWAKHPELKPKPKEQRGMEFAMARLDKLILKSEKEKQASAAASAAAEYVPFLTKSLLQAELAKEQTYPSFKPKDGMAAGDFRTLPASAWHGIHARFELRETEKDMDCSCKDARAIAEEAWLGYVEMKKSCKTERETCGKDARAIAEEAWLGYVEMKKSCKTERETCGKDARAIAEAAWTDYVQMKKAAEFSSMPINDDKVARLRKFVAMIWPPCSF
eukprot:symbB.v1.2.038466.t1/scaffold6001.1/size21876/2